MVRAVKDRWQDRRQARRAAGLCIQCPEEKAEPAFKGGLCEAHYRRNRESSKTNYAASEERRRKSGDRCRLYSYGISAEEYERLLTAQGGVCAICRQPETQVGGRRGTTLLSLAVDHDHITGKVRGLLCRNCNQALGRFGDDPERLRAAIAYLLATAEVPSG